MARRYIEIEKQTGRVMAKVRGSFVFTPWESRRLIGKAVAALPAVQTAYKEAEMIIAHGSTNVFVAEELMGYCPNKEFYLSGQVINSVLCQTHPAEKPPMIKLVRGELVQPAPMMDATLRNFDERCVFIKGGNAVDHDFNAGVFCAHPGAGTIGFAYGMLSARGSHLIVPIGLEKLVPSVPRAARYMGQDTFYYHAGQRTGMLPLVNATVITEIQAFDILFDVEAIHVGGGGAMGSEGSVVLVAEAEQAHMDEIVRAYEAIKGEKPLKTRKAICETCIPTTPSIDLSPEEQQKMQKHKKHCLFEGIKEEDLPHFFTPRTEPVVKNR
jgi:hypothetical protein